MFHFLFIPLSLVNRIAGLFNKRVPGKLIPNKNRSSLWPQNSHTFNLDLNVDSGSDRWSKPCLKFTVARTLQETHSFKAPSLPCMLSKQDSNFLTSFQHLFQYCSPIQSKCEAETLEITYISHVTPSNRRWHYRPLSVFEVYPQKVKFILDWSVAAVCSVAHHDWVVFGDSLFFRATNIMEKSMQFRFK